jgi:hypothetical protein
MDLESFVAALQHLDAKGIAAASTELDLRVATAAGEVSWWRATVAIDRQLRARRAGRLGALAAHKATAAVMGAAMNAGVPVGDPRVIAVARAAADVARGLVVQAPAAHELLRGCQHLVIAA